MRLIFAILFLLVFAVSCTKSDFTTNPQLKIKSVSATEIFGDQTLEFVIRLTDKEGDFSSFFGYSGTTTNCAASDFSDSSLLTIPDDFINSKNNDGDLVIDLTRSLRHSNFCPAPGNTFETDTTVYSFWTKDRAGNVSDTVSSGPIIIHP